MKKLYFLLSGMTLSLSLAFAQAPTFELYTITATTTPIANGTTFDKTTVPSADASYYFKLKNISASTQTYVIRRYDNSMNTVNSSDFAQAYFCTGTTCYQPPVTSTVFVVGAGIMDDFIVYLTEASIVGESNVSYEISNGSEDLTITMRYNYALGVTTHVNYLSHVSDVYPNPSSSKAFISLNSVKPLNGTNMQIINCLGSVVSSKEINLNKGKNTLEINTENLETGIYFVKITNGSSAITKKLTVTK